MSFSSISLSIRPYLVTLFRIFCSITIVSFSSVASLLYLFQRKLIYPSHFPSGARSDKTDPSLYSLPFEDLRLKTPDGETLQAWFIRPDDDGNPRSKRNVTIVMFQANAGNIAQRLPLASIFWKAFSVNILMFSYRGYGLSTGSPSEEGLKIDAQVVLNWLEDKVCYSEKYRAGLAYPLVILYGQSLGGAVAIHSAVRNSRWIKGLIIENTFLDIPSLIPTVLPPARFFTWLCPCTEIWSSRTTIPDLRVRTKVLFLSGKKDELVPPSHMRELYTLCPRKEGKGKEWASFPTGTHNDTWRQDDYFNTIALFLRRYYSFVTPLSESPFPKGFFGKYDDDDDERITAHLTPSRKNNAKKIYPGFMSDTGDELDQFERLLLTGRRSRSAYVGYIFDDNIEEIETEGFKEAREWLLD